MANQWIYCSHICRERLHHHQIIRNVLRNHHHNANKGNWIFWGPWQISSPTPSPSTYLNSLPLTLSRFLHIATSYPVLSHQPPHYLPMYLFCRSVVRVCSPWPRDQGTNGAYRQTSSKYLRLFVSIHTNHFFFNFFYFSTLVVCFEYRRLVGSNSESNLLAITAFHN